MEPTAKSVVNKKPNTHALEVKEYMKAHPNVKLPEASKIVAQLRREKNNPEK